mgnify:FL=1
MSLIHLDGRLEVYRVRDGISELVHAHKNTVNVALRTACVNMMISRSIEKGFDAMAWGSYSSPGGTFLASDWAGTTSSGTQGGLVQSNPTTSSAKLSGTFSFSSQKLINYFQAGRGYAAAGAGVSSLFTTLYAYDSSLLTGSNSITYENGDALILNWTWTLS